MHGSQRDRGACDTKKTFSICRQNEPAQSPPVGTAVPLPNGRPGVSAEVTVAHLPHARRKASGGSTDSGHATASPAGPWQRRSSERIGKEREGS
jgi:hypothetical protein